MTRVLLCTSFLSFFGIYSSTCLAEVISFEEGVSGSPVGTFYAGRGVTFHRASFISNAGLLGAEGELSMYSTTEMYQPSVHSPIVAIFAVPQSSVSLTGLNVGANGFRLDAYSAVLGGTLIDSAAVFGTGVDPEEFYTLTVSGPGLQRIEFYQPINVVGDGILFDTLRFTSGPAHVPEPSGIVLLCTAVGFAATAHWSRRRRNRKNVEPHA